MALDLNSISGVITAIGALGTASFGLVDATKVFGGGVSRCGLGDIRRALLPLFEGATDKKDLSTPLTYASVYANLKANWINGTDLGHQKEIAKSLLKLRLSATTAAVFAKGTGVDAEVLSEVAVALNMGMELTKEEADTYSRFDLALTALLDQAYQRADQRYRNSAKALAGVFSVAIALAGGWILSSPTLAVGTLHGSTAPYSPMTANFWFAALAGALATPLAPIAKDLTSALAAGVSVAQKISAK
jgi:hypothetical protein